jgi:hypothetical protein
MKYNSIAPRYDVPESEDGAFITIAFIPNGDDTPKLWLDINVGHTGEETMASAHALAAMTGQAIRHGMPIAKVVKTLRGVSQSGSNHLMSRHNEYTALSVADALGRALQKAFLSEDGPTGYAAIVAEAPPSTSTVRSSAEPAEGSETAATHD